jgi:hypothetical protein
MPYQTIAIGEVDPNSPLSATLTTKIRNDLNWIYSTCLKPQLIYTDSWVTTSVVTISTDTNSAHDIHLFGPDTCTVTAGWRTANADWHDVPRLICPAGAKELTLQTLVYVGAGAGGDHDDTIYVRWGFGGVYSTPYKISTTAPNTLSLPLTGFTAGTTGTFVVEFTNTQTQTTGVWDGYCMKNLVWVSDYD